MLEVIAFADVALVQYVSLFGFFFATGMAENSIISLTSYTVIVI